MSHRVHDVTINYVCGVVWGVARVSREESTPLSSEGQAAGACVFAHKCARARVKTHITCSNVPDDLDTKTPAWYVQFA